MRGIYNITHEDRRKFFHALNDLCKTDYDEVDLVSSQLSLCNCLDLLAELEYYPEPQYSGGWEGEVWWICKHEDGPSISFYATAHYGELDMYWTGRDNDEAIETEKLEELMRKHWGKYFPVI